MKRRILLSLFILLLAGNTFAQNKTYFGFEFSLANDIFKIRDNGDYLKPISLYNFQGGVHLRQEVSKYFFIEAGVTLKTYQEGYGFRTIPYEASSSSENSWLIPLRFGANVNLYKHRINLVPIVGYTFGINPPLNFSGFGYGTQRSTTSTIYYTETDVPVASRFFSLLQLGIGLEFKVSNGLLFTASANDYKGFQTTDQLEISYVVNSSPVVTGTATSKGDFWCVSTGVKYAISNFWKKR